jgi:nitric oxide reductase NorQ protein
MVSMYSEKYASIGGKPNGYWATLVNVLNQSEVDDVRIRLSASVTPQGRYVERATRTPGGAKAKAIATKVVDAIEGDEVYIRPNGSAYHTRPWGEHTDVAALRKAREVTASAFTTGVGSPMFALLYGSPGCGKTALVEAAFGGSLFTILGTGDTEVADMIGGYVQTPSGGFEWIDGDLIKAAETGGVYFIDEIGLIDPKVLSIVYGLMDGRREITVTANPERGTVKAHPEFYVIAATNPNAPGVRLSEALLSRFTVQAEMTTDWNLARKLGVSATMVTAAQNLSKKQAGHEVSWAPQFRELLAFRDISTAFGVPFAMSNLLAAAPEIDRAVVADILTRAFGSEVKPAKI